MAIEEFVWNLTNLSSPQNVKRLVLLQGIFSLLFLITKPLYTIRLNFHTLSSIFVGSNGDNPVSLTPDRYTLTTNLLEGHCINSTEPVFRSSCIIIGFILVATYSFGSGRRNFKEKNHTKICSDVLFGLFIWWIFCQYCFIPLRTVLLSTRHDSLFGILRHVIYVLVSICLLVAAFPFSLSSGSPIHQKTPESLSEMFQNSHAKIRVPNQLECTNVYDLNYSWHNLLVVCVFSISCMMLYFRLFGSNPDEGNDSGPDSISSVLGTEVLKEIVEPGQVRKMSSRFEQKRNIETTLKEYKPLRPKTHEAASLLNQKSTESSSSLIDNKKSAVRVQEEVILPVQSPSVEQTKMLAKVRPLNITQPLKVADSTQTSPLAARHLTLLEHQKSVEVETSNASCQVKIVAALTDKGTQQTVGCRNVGYQTQPPTDNASQQTDQTVVIETSQQTDDPLPAVDKGVTCEILSQERFTKLQQSALLLYQKTVEKYNLSESHKVAEKSKTSSRRKLRSPSSSSSSAVTKHDKSVQIDFVSRHHQTKAHVITDVQKPDDTNKQGKVFPSEYLEVQSQTELVGYVLDKILQEREASNIYNKQNLEKTVHSVVTLTERIKQHTDVIRFKAMKSQHGVWYVSLRADIFLTISQDVLMNVKLNEVRKIETEVPRDILRTMKVFVDNYNKLSDCFDDEEESDDESFINGFRL